MSAAEIIALTSAGLTTVVAVVVPFLAFRFAIRQEQTRWLREQRAQLYVDLLTEAYAEKQQFEFDISDEDVRERMRAYYIDLRLPPPERARLGARCNIIGSLAVNRRFSAIERACNDFLFGPADEGRRIVARGNVAVAVEELQAEIRQELGPDGISLASRGWRRIAL